MRRTFSYHFGFTFKAKFRLPFLMISSESRKFNENEKDFQSSF
eukprot:UN18434